MPTYRILNPDGHTLQLVDVDEGAEALVRACVANHIAAGHAGAYAELHVGGALPGADELVSDPYPPDPVTDDDGDGIDDSTQPKRRRR